MGTTIEEQHKGEGRIYRADYIIPGEGGAQVVETRLVRAKTQAAARNHAMRSRCGVRVANQDDMVALLSRGIVVESALGVEAEGEKQ